MNNFEKVIQYILLAISLLIAVIAVQPADWQRNIFEWTGLLNFQEIDWTMLLAIGIILSMTLFYYRGKKEITLWSTRKKWWDKKLPKIIATSDKLVVVDSYQGSKHEFWTSLEKRMNEAAPFHLVMLDLDKSSQLLKYCMETSRVTEEVLDIDIQAIKRLIDKRDSSNRGGNKTIEFGHWEGECQGPLVAWTISNKEIIAAGLWQQVEGSTDLSPWIVSKSGPLHTSLKKHYESLIQDARKNGKILFK